MANKHSLPFTPLTALSPPDGRYREQVAELAEYTSEHGLIKTRVEVEIRYLLKLSDFGVIRKLTAKEKKILEHFYQNFTLGDAEKIKEIEKETRHDVKAVEKFLRESLQNTTLKDALEMIHFGLTSEDVNNLSYRLMLQKATEDVCLPHLLTLVNKLTDIAEKYKDTPMIARTHGQPAVPTTLGKELVVFATRLQKEINLLQKIKLTGKLNGAVGNFNALVAAYPKINWQLFAREFISSFGLEPNMITTQINPYEDIIFYLQIYQRINNTILDFDQDMWRYISDEYFVQEVKKNEVGSSTMPQKVNPIFFENSEGSIGMANAIIEFMTRKLSVSRLQRDLSDSTVIRNNSMILAYSLLSYKSTLEGLKRVSPNLTKIHEALHADWAILTEGVQTILRQEDIADSYTLVKSLSLGRHLSENDWGEWINNLPVEDSVKKRIAALTPDTYIGLAVILTENAIKDIKK